MKNTKPYKKTLLCRTVVILLLLVVLGINAFIYFNRSWAWFADNKTIQANGAKVNLAYFGVSDVYFSKEAGEVDYTEISSWDHLFLNLSPGESVSIKAQYTNHSDVTRKLSVYFGLPYGSTETPVIKNGDTGDKYYYLSTQLKITGIAVNGVTQSIDENMFLMTPPSDKIAYESEQTPQNLPVAEINLPSGESATAELTIEFINYPDIDQNDYQGFGKGTENCFRQLIAYIDA
ncbi:MAG: hypothetical protein SPH68_04935 [Candidatus Borkfalkiaceae bacterium]|nr:hypothetical protein [Clostridia bacterium]MDY6223485.1 hypothetical protein [Christensenellaceae bacterium]